MHLYNACLKLDIFSSIFYVCFALGIVSATQSVVNLAFSSVALVLAGI